MPCRRMAGKIAVVVLGDDAYMYMSCAVSSGHVSVDVFKESCEVVVWEVVKGILAKRGVACERRCLRYGLRKEDETCVLSQKMTKHTMRNTYSEYFLHPTRAWAECIDVSPNSEICRCAFFVRVCQCPPPPACSCERVCLPLLLCDAAVAVFQPYAAETLLTKQPKPSIYRAVSAFHSIAPGHDEYPFNAILTIHFSFSERCKRSKQRLFEWTAVSTTLSLSLFWVSFFGVSNEPTVTKPVLTARLTMSFEHHAVSSCYSLAPCCFPCT